MARPDHDLLNTLVGIARAVSRDVSAKMESTVTKLVCGQRDFPVLREEATNLATSALKTPFRAVSATLTSIPETSPVGKMERLAA